MTTYHLSVSVEGLLYHIRKTRKDLPIILKDDGRYMTRGESIKFLKECQKKGWKYIPTHDCEGFDHFEKGCPGHSEIENTEP